MMLTKRLLQFGGTMCLRNVRFCSQVTDPSLPINQSTTTVKKNSKISTVSEFDDVFVDSMDEIEVSPSTRSFVNKLKRANIPTEMSKLSEFDTQPTAISPASVVKDTPTFKYLLAIGVSIPRIEEFPGLIDELATFSVTKQIKEFLDTMRALGVSDVALIINRYPPILTLDSEKLKHRVSFLHSEKFNRDQILTIIHKNPRWFSTPVNDVRKQLEAVRDTFGLTPYGIRDVASRCPRIVSTRVWELRKVHYVIKTEFRFSWQQMKEIIAGAPSVLLIPAEDMAERLDYLINTMNISRDLILENPLVMSTRLRILQPRYEMLLAAGLAQFNPREPGYISLKQFVSGTELQFCENFNIKQETYFDFLKTM